MAKKGLDRWFSEKWTNQKGDPCGSGTTKGEPKCRPSKRVTDKTPATWGELTPSQKKRAVTEKNKATKQGKQTAPTRFERTRKLIKDGKK